MYFYKFYVNVEKVIIYIKKSMTLWEEKSIFPSQRYISVCRLTTFISETAPLV